MQDRREILLSKIDLLLKQGKINPKKAPVKHVFNFLESKFKIKFDVQGDSEPNSTAAKT